MYLNYSAMKKIFSTSESSRKLHSQTKSIFFFRFCPVFSPSQCFLLQLTLVTKSCIPTMRSEKTVKCPKNFDWDCGFNENWAKKNQKESTKIRITEFYFFL